MMKEDKEIRINAIVRFMFIGLKKEIKFYLNKIKEAKKASQMFEKYIQDTYNKKPMPKLKNNI